jgi:predicted nucleic acid-binding protein
MIVVLDVSVALGILLGKEGSEKDAEVLTDANTVIAPELYLSEIANAAWKHHKLLHFTPAEAMSLAEDGIGLVDHYVPAQEVWKEALCESIAHDHPVYDAVYGICARRNAGLLLTCDERLKQLCRKLGVEVI